MKIDDVKKIAVIGSGAMGHGIAQVCATAGYSVYLADIKQEFLDNAAVKVKESLSFLVNKGKIKQEEMDKIIGVNLKTTLDVGEAVSGAQVVIEAVPEVMSLKKRLFTDISALASPDAVLATNTSTMSISEIGSAVKNPERFAGMHFFNPVPAMKLVEVIFGKNTSAETADLLCNLNVKCGKISVKVMKDRPGFIVNRINSTLQAFLNAILEEGKIKPAEIDCVMKKMGFKLAPFETADFVGLDVFTHTLGYYSETLSPDYKPGKFLMDKVAKNELGKKTGKGIYDWSSGKAVIDSSVECKEITPIHFLSIQINEAVKVYKEGIALSVEDIDNAVKFGMGSFAGPFTLTAGMQPEQISGALNFLHERFGLSIFKPEPEIIDGSFKAFGK
jgi:enoyl-CoA hydratase/3-hydroxyacyl-CoA dehydrogenase